MKYRNVTLARIGRKTHRAVALTLALALGGGLATTAVANPRSMAQALPTSAAEQQAQQALAARQAHRTAGAAQVSAQPMTTYTYYVTNCNDSGSGSLRYLVDQYAVSGDTIDMYTKSSCNEINLESKLIVNQADLTLLGESQLVGSELRPFTHIHGSDGNRTIEHTGTGTLTLTYIDLSDGGPVTNHGACIWSSGSVMIDRSYVHDCIAERGSPSTRDVTGGAIYAEGEVTLSGSSVAPYASSQVYDNVARAGDADAYGGGIYAKGWVRIGSHSSVFGNLAESINGNANGGGIYGKHWVDLTESSSAVRDNKAETRGALTEMKGFGIYTEWDSIIYGSVTGNSARYVGNSTWYPGKGGGIYAEEGVESFAGSSFSDNHGSVTGGGIFTNGYLILYKSTVADNSGDDAGAIFAKGDVTIDSSTISGNQSAWSANIKLGPAATSRIVIQSSTISNNTITGDSENGAALNLQHDATIENSTITGNIARNSTQITHGAGISLDNALKVELLSNIIGGNYLEDTNGNPTFPSNFGLVNQGSYVSAVTGDHNLIHFPGVPVPPDTLTAQAPRLGPLADNGGLTKTHEPCRNSIVIDNGATNGHTDDQRGSGFPRAVGFEADIGAIEAPSYIDDILFRNGFEDGACES